MEFVSAFTGVLDGPCQLAGGSSGSVSWISSGDFERTASVLAMAEGIEYFEDANSNGLYDFGEEFTDIGEPYLQIVDDDVIDPGSGEYFKDLDGDGEWDSGGNGVWDGPCSLTTSECTENSSVILFDQVNFALLCPDDDTIITGCPFDPDQ